MIQERPINLYKEFIRNNLSSWSNIPEDQIQMTKLTSYSREVYKVVAINNTLKPIIFRVLTDTIAGLYKRPEGLFISFEEELLVYSEAYKCRLGPKIYIQNNNYRIEEYIEGGKISYDSIHDPLFRRRFTYTISRWNKLNVKGLKREESYFIHYFSNGKETFNKFAEVCSLKHYNEEEKKIMDEIRGFVDVENIEYLKGLIKLDDNVFSHGDLNPLNIIYQKETNHITLVDYERAGIYLRGDDFGNFIFFNIFNHFYPDQPSVIESNIPSKEMLLEISQYYWIFTDLKNEEENNELVTKLIHDKSIFNSYLQNVKTKEFDNKVERLTRQIKISLVVNIFFWCVLITSLFCNSSKREMKIFIFIQNCYHLFKRLVNTNWIQE